MAGGTPFGYAQGKPALQTAFRNKAAGASEAPFDLAQGKLAVQMRFRKKASGWRYDMNAGRAKRMYNHRDLEVRR